jgi:hypothetical protein
MDEDEPQPSRPRSAPVFDNRTHRAYAFRRTGRGKSATGKLRWAGLGYIGTTRKPEDIAAAAGVHVDVVRQILSFATAHLFVEMRPETGGTGYFFMLPKDTKRPRRIPEPDDPREDDEEDGDGDDQQN